MALNRQRRNHHPFDDRVRISFKEEAIFESARLALVRVADDIGRFACVARHKAPLHSGGEASSASSSNSGFLYLFNNSQRIQGERLAYRLIATTGLIPSKRMLIPLFNVLQKNLAILSHRVSLYYLYLEAAREAVTLHRL